MRGAAISPALYLCQNINMIKANKINANVAINSDFLDKFTGGRLSPIAEAKRQADSLANDVEHLKRLIAEHTEGLASAETKLTKNKTLIEQYDPEPLKEKARRELAALGKINRLAHVELRADSLTITTHPLFTDVRIGDGERKTKRRCLGSYSLRIPLIGGDICCIEIDNTIYPPRLHWAASSSGVLCLGDWQDTVDAARNKGDLSVLVNTMLLYLKSTVDGAAYWRSHDWIMRRDEALEQRFAGGRKKLEIGDAVVLKGSRRLRGIISKIHPSNSSFMMLTGRKSEAGESLEEIEYWYPVLDLVKITKVEYKRKEMVQTPDYFEKKMVGKNRGASIIKAIDAAPDTITNDELKKILK